MALTRNFPNSPYEVLDPKIRWFPADESFRGFIVEFYDLNYNLLFTKELFLKNSEKHPQKIEYNLKNPFDRTFWNYQEFFIHKVIETNFPSLDMSKLKTVLSNQGNSRIADIRQQLQDTMTEHCGIFRDDQLLKDGLQKLQTIRDRYEHDLLVDDRGSVFNMELMQAIELKSLFTVGEIIMTSALSRQESRGAHSREDFPTRDDANYLKHTLGYLENGAVKTSDRPVDMSLQLIDSDRFTPQERKY